MRLPNNKESMSLFPNSMEIDVKLVSKKLMITGLKSEEVLTSPFLLLKFEDILDIIYD